MRRPQFSIRNLLWLTLVVAIGCVLGPPFIQSATQWLWPPVKPSRALPFETPTEFPED